MTSYFHGTNQNVKMSKSRWEWLTTDWLGLTTLKKSQSIDWPPWVNLPALSPYKTFRLFFNCLWSFKNGFKNLPFHILTVYVPFMNKNTTRTLRLQHLSWIVESCIQAKYPIFKKCKQSVVNRRCFVNLQFNSEFTSNLLDVWKDFQNLFRIFTPNLLEVWKDFQNLFRI